jgi:hypothetical protein
MARRETIPGLLTELSREALIGRVLELEAQLAEAQAQIAELRRQLFGSKVEKLSPDEQMQMDELASDLQQAAQQPPPLSQEVLEEERRDQRRRRAERQPVRHPVPPVLETETVTLEPAAEEKLCPHCGCEKQRIGEEVTEEIDLIPARLIRRRTVCPKICLPLWGSRRRDRTLAAAPDPAKQVGAESRRPSAAGALRRSPRLLYAGAHLPRTPCRRDSPPADGEVG